MLFLVAPKETSDEGEVLEVSQEDALVTMKDFQILENKVDELILLQKEVAAKMLEMNRVRQAQAKQKKKAPKATPKPKPNPLKFP